VQSCATPSSVQLKVAVGSFDENVKVAPDALVSWAGPPWARSVVGAV
jgi:hypothetical protein